MISPHLLSSPQSQSLVEVITSEVPLATEEACLEAMG